MASSGFAPRIGSFDDAARFFAGLVNEPLEVGAFAYLGRDNALLGVRHVRDGLSDQLHLPLRAVVRDALAFEAVGVVMAHNHPSGDPRPSARDRETTAMLAGILDPLEVRLLDHLVLARGGISSFRALGWL